MQCVGAVSEHERRFSARMVNIRKMRDLTQHQLAAGCGLHRSVIAAIETGGRGIRLGEAIVLCAHLGVDLGAMTSERPMVLSITTPVD